jgi:tetratricopeptide (TPR) repeat protein
MIEASDQLRSGIAVQSLRSALEVFTREDYPAEWSSATINLANALIYTPSAHQGDNVVEAIEKYEEVLELRDRDVDPIGRARLLANQGNALAHLGIFDHAKSKLVEARFLFEEQLDHDSVMMVRSLLDEIAKTMVPERDAAGDVIQKVTT